MNNYLVSIITPLFNSAQFLELTAKSVLSQSYINWEWIIIDDNSIDNSYLIAKNLAEKDDRIHVLKNSKNYGSGITRNIGIQFANGNFITFIDSDDLWHVDKLKLHLDFMLKSGASFSHTSYGYIDEMGNRIKSTFHVSKKPVTYIDLLKRTEISCLTAMYNVDRIGKFYMSEHKRKQDYALWLSILKTGVCSNGLDQELAFYRQRKGSATSNKYKLIVKHFQFLCETQNMNFISSLYYTSYWFVNGFIRYYIK